MFNTSTSLGGEVLEERWGVTHQGVSPELVLLPSRFLPSFSSLLLFRFHLNVKSEILYNQNDSICDLVLNLLIFDTVVDFEIYFAGGGFQVIFSI